VKLYLAVEDIDHSRTKIAAYHRAITVKSASGTTSRRGRFGSGASNRAA
jgi:hypothetical protein